MHPNVGAAPVCLRTPARASFPSLPPAAILAARNSWTEVSSTPQVRSMNGQTHYPVQAPERSPSMAIPTKSAHLY